MKRLAILILSIIALTFSAKAQIILPSEHPEADSIALSKIKARLDSIRRYRPTVALVLSGGGARGLAHLGVIRLLEEEGIPVDVVMGTSMGGMLAGLYSLGYDHKEMDAMVREIDWPVMMSDKIPDAYVSYRLRKYRERFALDVPFHYDNEDLRYKKLKEMDAQIDKLARATGTSTGDVLEEAISRMGIGMPDGLLYGINIRNIISTMSVGYQDSISFADLPRPVVCVATDMVSLKPKYWTSGSIANAIRSTMSIPFYFRAVREEGEILVDGGMRNNYPVDVAKALGADIIIGSEMSTRRRPDELNSPVDFVLQTINLLGAETLDNTIHMSDVNVHHTLAEYNMLSFDEESVNNIIADGYQNALAFKEQFHKISSMIGGKAPEEAPVPKPAVNISRRKVKVSEVVFEGLTTFEQKHIIHHRHFPSDGLYGKKEIEHIMNYIYGTNAFESVTYRLQGSEEPYVLVFDCVKGQVNDLAVGLHADTDEYVYISASLGIGTRRLSGFRFITDLKLGSNPRLTLDAAFRPMVGIPSVGASLRGYLLNSSHVSEGYPVQDRLLSTGADFYFEDSRMTYGSMRVGVSFEQTPFERRLSFDTYQDGWDWKNYWASAFVDLCFDTSNDRYFPTKGFKTTLDGRYVFSGHNSNLRFLELVPDGKVPGYASVFASVSGAISPAESFTVLPALYVGWNSVQTRLMNPLHAVSVGGILQGRYVDRQMPFFGFAAGFQSCRTMSASAQMDLRYCLARKNFITLRGGTFIDADSFVELQANPYLIWAVGAEYARQTIVGPLKAAVQWCNDTGFSVSASIGFDF